MSFQGVPASFFGGSVAAQARERLEERDVSRDGDDSDDGGQHPVVELLDAATAAYLSGDFASLAALCNGDAFEMRRACLGWEERDAEDLRWLVAGCLKRQTVPPQPGMQALGQLMTGIHQHECGITRIVFNYF